MQLEIQVALNFVISYLYNKLPRRRVNIFGEALERQLRRKYEGHWYPERPCRGSAFRCVHVGVHVDPVVERAAAESGLDIADVRSNLPQDLSVWIDPFEVSYQIGESGAVKVLYLDAGGDGGSGGGGSGSELEREMASGFNPEAQVFMPVSEAGAASESSSPSPTSGASATGSPSFPPPPPRAAAQLTFTTAAFAATKFGSTKMKSSGGRSNGSNAVAAGAGGCSAAGNGNSKAARSSPTSLGVAAAPSMQALYGLGPKPSSALSPNAKEFVFPGMGGAGIGGVGALPPGDGPLSPLHYGAALDVFSAYGGLQDSLAFSLASRGHSNQQFQPVMAN